MDLLLFLVILVLIFGGAGFALHALWVVAIVVLFFAFARFASGGYYSRWRGRGGPPPGGPVV